MTPPSLPRPSTLYDPGLGSVLVLSIPRKDVTPLTLVIRQLAYWSGSDQDPPKVRRPGREIEGLHHVPMRRADWMAVFPTFRTSTVERTLALGVEAGVLRVRRDRHVQWCATDCATLLGLYAAASLVRPGWLGIPRGSGVQLSADVALDVDNILSETRDFPNLESRLGKSRVSDSGNPESLTLDKRRLLSREEEEAGRPPYPESGNRESQLPETYPATKILSEQKGIHLDDLRVLNTWIRRYHEEGYWFDDIILDLWNVTESSGARDQVAYLIGMLRSAWEETSSPRDAAGHLYSRAQRRPAVDRSKYQGYFARRNYR